MQGARAQTSLFAPVVSYPTGGQTESVALSDLDGDGDLDMAAANRSTDDLSVLMNNGDGSFAPEVRYAGVGNGPHWVGAGDLDGDGDADLAVARVNSPYGLRVMLNNGAGTFALAGIYATSGQPLTGAIGDFDADGDLDVIVGNNTGDTISVLRNNGDATFAPHLQYPVGDGLVGLGAGDLDGDGDLDVAVANRHDDDVSVLLNNGNGTFAPQVRYPAGDTPRGVAIADLDGDGDADLATSNGDSDVSVLMNNGNGTFAPQVRYPVNGISRPVAAVDLDADGDLDLVTGSGATQTVSLLINDGDGTFAPYVTFGAVDSVTSLAVGDLDGDGDPDLAASSFFGSVQVLLNDSSNQPPTLVASYDFEGDFLDGTVNGNDGTAFDSVGFAPGLFGQAASFDGTNDHIEVPPSASLNLSAAMTLSAWINPTTIPNGNAGVIFKGDLSGQGPYDMFIGWSHGDTNASVMINDASVIASQPNATALGTWQHLASTYDGSNLILYLDGLPIVTVPFAGSINQEVSPLHFGQRYASWNDYHGLIDQVRIYNRALSPSEIASLATPPNLPPTAAAGPDQAVRVGDPAYLDGTASFDDNTASELLGYAWSFSSKPTGSTASLTGADTSAPSFVADLAGTYVVELIVTDEGGLSSTADEVEFSSDNMAPTADAGDDQLVLAGLPLFLDGSASSDPEMDALTYAWTITEAPDGSTAELVGDDTDSPMVVTDLPGLYVMTLVVSDFLGPGAPDSVEITASSPEDYAEFQIIAAADFVWTLGNDEIIVRQVRRAFAGDLSRTLRALRRGHDAWVVRRLRRIINRTDGCALRGSPDGNGRSRDWITDCTAQAELYDLLNEAMDAMTP